MRNQPSQNGLSFSLLAAAIFSLVVVLPLLAMAQDASTDKGRADHKDRAKHEQTKEPNLVQELRALQTKIAALEAALKQNHQAAAPDASAHASHHGKHGSSGDATPGGSKMQMGSMGKQMGMGMMSGMSGKSGQGMNGMGMGKSGQGGMGMGGMMEHPGMKMMGRMKGMGSMQMATTLPGFPGASHIYHIGATAFFLDHPQHITLTTEQQKQLNGIKQKTLLGQATFDRWIDQAEQEVWVLTSADAPDAAKVEAKVREIAKLTADKRIAYIQAVGEAARVLTDEQRKTLVGHLPPQHASGGNAQD